MGEITRASERDRTSDLLITNQPLYRLSYAGPGSKIIAECPLVVKQRYCDKDFGFTGGDGGSPRPPVAEGGPPFSAGEPTGLVPGSGGRGLPPEQERRSKPEIRLTRGFDPFILID
jgi:hypothetical protein